MSRFPVDRYNEQRLIEEVRYLHSLWHQGPPRPHPTTTYPTPAPTPLSLQPSSSTQFKKTKKKSKGIKRTQTNDSGVEWPCPTPAKSPTATDSGWPNFTTKPNPQPHLPTSNELAHFAANQAHQHALKAASEYLKYSNNGEDDDDDGYDAENDDAAAMETEEGLQDYNFFVKLFTEDGALREYYEKNHESGEFSCLVCCGLGKKGWRKRFKDCVALVQHSTAIANTNNRQAHRAYGQVICKILGWDINRLPSIVLSAADKPSESSDKPGKVQGNEDDVGKNGLSGLSNTTDAVNICSDEVSQREESFNNENQQGNGGGTAPLEGNVDDDGKNGLCGVSNAADTANICSDELSKQKESFSNENQQENGGTSTAVEHDSLSEANANRSLEDISIGIPETAKENAEGASICLEPSQEDNVVVNGETNSVKDGVSQETTVRGDKS